MNINTGQRTYFLGLSGTAPFLVNVPFVDTLGNIIDCNYFSITIHNATQGWVNGYLVELSGVSKSGSVTTNSTIRPLRFNTDLALSGICGLGGVIGAGYASTNEWHGCNGEHCTGISIKLEGLGPAGDNNTIMAITYGNLFPYNILRSDMYDKGV